MSASSVATPIFVIPVRGGSKGVLGKNLRMVGGVSLLGRAVRSALAAARLLGEGRVIVDSEDEELLEEGRRWGAETPYVRPAALATDEARSIDVVRHAIRALGIEHDSRPFGLVQATSPLTPPEHIADAVRRHREAARPAVSVSQSGHPPEWQYRVENGVLQPVLQRVVHRRQDTQATVMLTGSVYVASCVELAAGREFVQPGFTIPVMLDPEFVLDVDSEHDLRAANARARRPTKSFRIGQHEAGSGAGPFIAIELAGSRGTSTPAVERLLDDAAFAGASGVRFAIPGLNPPLQGELARRRGLALLGSVSDGATARMFHAVGAAALTVDLVGSSSRGVLSEIGDMNLPILLRTTTTDPGPLARTVDAYLAGKAPFALVHAPALEGATCSKAPLSQLIALRDALGVQIGYSDQLSGDVERAVLAMGAGLSLFELRLTTEALYESTRARLAQFCASVRVAERELRGGELSA